MAGAFVTFGFYFILRRNWLKNLTPPLLEIGSYPSHGEDPGGVSPPSGATDRGGNLLAQR